MLRSLVISSQLVHREFGGVVPELASRAHLRLIVPAVQEALRKAEISKDEIDGIGVTYGPGLMGALMVGVNFAKALAYGLNVPFVGVNHMEAHVYSNFIDEPKPSYPFLCLTVSGGHTQLVAVTAPLTMSVLGETLDDAAGEAYDKVAKMLGLGFPGGPAIDVLARGGDPDFVRFPRSYPDEENFSFSGIKTAVLYWLRDNPEKIQPHRADLCASFQRAVIEVLATRTLGAARRLGIRNVALAGGVSANSELRRTMGDLAVREGFRLFVPKLEYCTDNAAMIALVAWLKIQRGETCSHGLNPVPNLSL